jgi:hypothetical protein
MNTLKIYIFIFTVMVSIQTTNAQNYKQQFKVNEKGEVSEGTGTKLGSIDSEGVIRNGDGEVVGKTEKSNDGTRLVNPKGQKMGNMQNGNFRNNKGDIIYTISGPDKDGMCKITDKSGKEIGVIHENYKEQGMCAIHCLGKKK